MRAEWFELPEEENKKSGIIISWTHPKKLEIAETHTRKIPKCVSDCFPQNTKWMNAKH